MRVSGDSMVEADIHSGDCSSSTAHHGRATTVGRSQVAGGAVPAPGSRRPDYAALYVARMLAGREACVAVRYRGQEAREQDTFERVVRMLPPRVRRLIWTRRTM